LAEVLEKAGEAAKAQTFTDVAEAFRQACAMAGDDDRIAAFGSFYTVAEVLGVLPARTSASS
jgi:dihydrofolate synthase / folylpolyglutamate synthase